MSPFTQSQQTLIKLRHWIKTFLGKGSRCSELRLGILAKSGPRLPKHLAKRGHDALQLLPCAVQFVHGQSAGRGKKESNEVRAADSPFSARNLTELVFQPEPSQPVCGFSPAGAESGHFWRCHHSQSWGQSTIGAGNSRRLHSQGQVRGLQEYRTTTHGYQHEHA